MGAQALAVAAPLCRGVLAFLFLALANPPPAEHSYKPPLVALPQAPHLTDKGHALILSFEGFDGRPAWPGGASGVTIGWGYDLGYYSRSVITQDWRELPDSSRQRLATQSGVTGRAAQARIASIRDILIDRGIGTRVFDNVDVAREFANCHRAFPGFDDLRPNAQAALISLTFNRGTSMIGDSRREMRAIRELVPSKDYHGMAEQFRQMIRVWRGTSIERGMRNRRLAEAQLMETV